jgi:hypothetical protein
MCEIKPEKKSGGKNDKSCLLTIAARCYFYARRGFASEITYRMRIPNSGSIG